MVIVILQNICVILIMILWHKFGNKTNNLKWYYAQSSLLKFGLNCYIFQKIGIYNNEKQINDNIS